MLHILACLSLSTSLWTSAAYAIDSIRFDEKECSALVTAGHGYFEWYSLNRSSPVSDVLLKFYVQARDNAHVFLSADANSQGYEIVIGAGQNTFSTIRKGTSKESDDVRTVLHTTTGILNVSKPIGFWIRVSQKSGLIALGKAGQELPFMYWVDSKPVPIKYFSFSAWTDSICKWWFRCKSDEPASAAASNRSESSDHIAKFLTNTERLKRDVLKRHSKFGIGIPVSDSNELFNVDISFYFRFIHLDVMTSTLTLRGQATIEWMDHSIHWDPRDYVNISKLHLSNYELWRPELVLHNALNPTASLFSETKMSVDNEGRIVWNPKFDIETKCNPDLKSWPWDRHNCTLTLSPWSHKLSNVVYEMVDNNKSKCLAASHSDWKLDRITSHYVLDDQTPWDDVIASVNDGEDNGSDGFKRVSLQLVVGISRNTKILEKLFFIPLLLISGLWLSSFCVMPNSSSKIAMICISIILTMSIVIYMTTYVPVFSEYPPDLLLVYLKLMLMMSTDVFVSSFLITVHNREKTGGHPPFALTRFLTTPVVTRLLVLPKLEYVPPDHEDNNSRLGDDGGLERPFSTAPVTLWDVVIGAFERLVFVTYFVITVILLSSIGIFVKS